MQLIRALRVLNNSFDADVKRLVRHSERTNNLKIQCRKNCSYCCYQLVSISLAEACNIICHIGESRITEMLPILKEDAKQLAEPSMTVHSAASRPCHFLKDNLCSIYPVRPFSCRSHVSFSEPIHCKEVGGYHKRLAQAHELCANYTMHIHEIGFNNPVAPMQYNLLVAWYLEMHGNMDALVGTSAYDVQLSLRAWKHFIEDTSQDEFEPVFPIWQHV